VPLLKINVVIFSLIPLFETGAYNQASLSLMSSGDVPSTPSPPWMNPVIFRGGSAHYAPKSVGGSGAIALEIAGEEV
jgi:hypothetical protein